MCCSADRSATISNTPHGVRKFCFRCKEPLFVPHPPRSIHEILAARRVTDALAARTVPTLPPDAVPLPDGPPAGWQWVLRGGLSPEDAADRYGMRWHEPTRRVLLPIYGPTGAMTALLGRAVHGERPKYLMLGGDKNAIYRTPKTDSKAVVVVEDILSAIAVSRTGINAVAVLGTALTATHAHEIARGASHVIGWFDPDAAGKQAWVRLRSRMALQPVSLSRITSAKDPKLLHRKEIRALIEQHTGA